jgi:PKD repeat protein
MRRPIGSLGAILLLLAALAASIPSASLASGDGTRALRPRRFQCGTVADLPARMARWHAEAARNAPARLELAADVDLGQIAVLFDGGNLVVSSFTDTTAIAQQFYATHPDDFDYLVIFISSAYNTDVQIEAGFAFHRRVRNDVSGIGIATVDNSGLLGLPTTRLKSIVQMNDLLEYLPHFDDPLPGFTGSIEGVEVLGQESGHQFASFAEVPGEEMLGRDLSHWSFFMHTSGSVMEGNDWQPDGNGWLSGPGFEHYSHLDEYLMGLRDAAAATEPIFVLDHPHDTGGRTASSPPEEGVRIRGTRQDISMAALIAAEGPRVPDASIAPKTFRAAFVLVVPGLSVPPGDLERMEEFRREWVDWFALETDNLGAMDTTLPGVPVSADFEAEVFAGPAPLAVAFRDLSRGPIESRLWEFGDGATSTETDPVHVYTQPGYFTVRLTVDGPGGPAVRVQPNRILVQPFVEVVRDDFESIDGGWLPGALNSALSGFWIRDDPVGTAFAGIPAQPEDDATPGAGTRCLVTANTAPGGLAGENDVDGGTTSIESRTFDLSGWQLPVIEYAYWFSNDLGGGPGADVLRLEVSPDGGGSWYLLDTVQRGDRIWRKRQVRLTNVLAPSAGIRFRFLASDLGLGSIVEAAIDDFRIVAQSGLPDADGDAIPDPADNCPGLPNPSQFDGDLDGVGPPCDCDDLDPAKREFPSTAIDIAADPADTTRFTWNPVPQAASYNVYRGQIPPATPFFYGTTCMEKHSLDTVTFDQFVPASQGWLYYLIAPENACGEAGLGASSAGVPRPFSVHCPPPITPGG